ncbi:hypothetical protein B0I35DRAFT_463615 [Stachybotrys elegans]|uniref:Ecp2 effector protein domain-containing protein n=1 Tax=Stachybotrys elegans TaxID=80388 RepID=A0A8K0SJZ1_9HYPO|nr:hypothetical protein B0I35DRAFT_463615 [Stachybotrys elegans]
MFFSTTFLVTVGMVAGWAQASPAVQPFAASDAIAPLVVRDEHGEIESFKNATALGVDIFGPIPSDARRVDDHWEADPGTPAWAWIRAQLDIDWDTVDEENLAKRQGSGNAFVNLSVWTGDGCTGGVVYHDDVNYNVNYPNNNNLFSMGLSRRAIRSNEHLDISRFRNGQACGQFVSRLAGSGLGCWGSLPVYNCFRLWVE